MGKIRGTVRTARIEHEGSNVILRFMVEGADRQKFPVEMRGQKILGVLEIGDEIIIEAGRIRDRYGVMRPQQVRNLTNDSVVRVTSPGVVSKFGRFLSSLIASIATSVLSGIIVKLLQSPPAARRAIPRSRPRGHATSEALAGNPLPLIVGLAVGVLVFWLVYRRQRRI